MAQLPAPSEEIRNKLNSLLLLGQTKGCFSKRSGLAQYAWRVLERQITAGQLPELDEGNLFQIECALQAEGLEAAS